MAFDSNGKEVSVGEAENIEEANALAYIESYRMIYQLGSKSYLPIIDATPTPDEIEEEDLAREIDNLAFAKRNELRRKLDDVEKKLIPYA